MEISELKQQALASILDMDGRVSDRMVLVVRRGIKGFPRGEFLCETERGMIRSFDPLKILEWVRKNERQPIESHT